MAHDPSAFIQEYFRIRRSDNEALDAAFDGGDPDENVNPTIPTGIPFRPRIKARETAGGSDSTPFKLQCRHIEGDNTWRDVNVASSGAGSQTPAFIYLSDQYADGDDIDTERLTSTSTYVIGEGYEIDGTTKSYSLTNEEIELEFCLILHAWYDYSGVAYQVQVGDTVELRLVEGDGTVFTGTYTNPSITIAETAGFIDGTFVETVNNVGPFCDSNGNLYIFLETSEEHNYTMCLKSTTGGDTWRLMDNANRPVQGDLEGYDVKPAGTGLLIAHGTSDADHQQFLTSDDGSSPDTWALTDETIEDTHTAHTTQKTALVVRGSYPSSYTVIAFYVDDASPATVRYKIRSTGGTWGSEQTLDTEATNNFLSPVAVLAGDGYTHVFYKDDSNGILYHNTISPSDVKGTRQSVATGLAAVADADNSPAADCFYYDDGGVNVVGIVYQKADDGVAYSRYLREDTETPGKYDLQSETTATDNGVGTNIGGCHQPMMATAVDGKVVYLLYCYTSSREIYRTSNDDEGGWNTDVLQETLDEYWGWISANVYTHNAGNGSAKVLGYIWDEASGGSGHAWYGEYEIPSAGGDVTFAGTAAMLTTTPAPMLNIAKAFAGTGALVTTTPDTVMLNKDIPFTGISALITTTPTITLDISKFFAGIAAMLTTTPDTVMLNKDVPFSGAAALLTTTPNTIMLAIDKAFSGTALLATVTPNTVMLNKDIPFGGTVSLVTTTPDNVALLIAKLFAGTAALVTTTPDIDLALDRAFGGTAALITATPSILLAVEKVFGGTAALVTTTPDIELLVTSVVQFAGTSALITVTPAIILDMARGFAGSAILVMTTPDSVMLNKAIPFTGTATLITGTPDTVMLNKAVPFSGIATLNTTTPDSVTLGLSKLFAGIAAMVTTTPAATLAVERAFAGSSALITVTPDTVTLEIAGTISFAGTAALQTITPAAMLSVARSFAGSAALVTTTPSGMLNVSRGFVGQAQLQTITSEPMLAIARSFAGTAHMQFTTTDLAILSLILHFTGTAHLQTTTPDDVELLLRVATGLVDILITARRPGVTISTRRPSGTISGRKPSIDITAET